MVVEQFFDNVMKVLRDPKVRGWFMDHAGQDVTGKTTCPVCGGVLRVRSSRSGRSGGGKCETEGCAEWMS